MSDDKLIVSVLPFENPKNNAERRFNDLAMERYLDRDSRVEGKGITAFIVNPDHFGHMYFCTATWTKQGWRTYTNCMDIDQVIAFADMCVSAEESLVRIIGEITAEVEKN